MPTDARGHADMFLSGVSMEFAQDQQTYIADKVFPTLPVEHKSDEYYVFPVGWFTRDHVRERALGDEPVEATYGLSSATYRTKEWALAATIDDRERSNISVDAYNPDEQHVRFLSDNHLIHREKIWAARFFTTGVWSSDITGVSSGPTGSQTLQWDQTNADPQKALNAFKIAVRRKIARGPNGLVLVLGEDVENSLRSSAAIIERTKYTSSESIDRALLSRYFGVDDILVPLAMQNVATELAPQFGDNVNLSNIVGAKGALLVYRNPLVGMKMATGGLTFQWRGLLGGQGFTMPVYRSRKERAWSDWFAVRTAYDMRVVSPDCGIFFSSLVA